VGKVADEKFVAVVSLIEALEPVHAGSGDLSRDRGRIEDELCRLMGQLSDEQLAAVMEWRVERIRQGQLELDDLKGKLAEAQAELNRRKGG
jgi:hypothetical protein